MTRIGEKILFLKKTYQRLEDGILITPGHYIKNMLEGFEEHYGMVRAQKVPCDGSIQVADVSLELDFNESTINRSLVGMAIYLSQERLDTSFIATELASKMSKPTITAMSRLKKLSGYLKQTRGYSMKFRIPEHGQGSRCSTRCGYVLESYSDSDWAGNKDITRRPCGSKKSDGSFAKNIPKLPSKNLSYKMWSLLSCQPSTRAKSLHFDALKQYPAPFTLYRGNSRGIF